MDHPNRKVVFQPPFFRGCVKLPGCKDWSLRCFRRVVLRWAFPQASTAEPCILGQARGVCFLRHGPRWKLWKKTKKMHDLVTKLGKKGWLVLIVRESHQDAHKFLLGKIFVYS